MSSLLSSYRHLFFFMLLFHCVLCIGNGVWLNFLRLACVFPLYAGTSFNSFSRGSFMSSCIDTFSQTLLNGRKRATRNQERLIFPRVNSTLLIIIIIFRTSHDYSSNPIEFDFSNKRFYSFETNCRVQREI